MMTMMMFSTCCVAIT